MDSRQGVRLVIGMMAFGAAVFIGQTPRWVVKFVTVVQSSQSAYAAETKAPELTHDGTARLFTSAEVYAFLTAAKHAELTRDPLQRCLNYPDPPGSHWTPAAVHAYCRYRMQAFMPFADMQTLLQNGKAVELDKRMAVMLAAQQTRPDARGLLDRTFDLAFDGSFDKRPILDAWKRDSPNSAFAYAASGLSYEKMAHAARGSAYSENTSADKQQSMLRLLQQADGDLQKAIELNPKIIPAYVAMISVGGLLGYDQYVHVAIKRALAADPANFSVYEAMLWDAQPKWGGSLHAMDAIDAAAKAHATENPLLTLLLEKRPAYELLHDCDCHSAQELANYTVIFDQVSVAAQLSGAAYAAESSHHLELAVVYFSEALRFDPYLADERLHRIAGLNNFDESQWAVDEATDLMRASPGVAGPVQARGYSYTMLNDYTHAEKDMLAALALYPGDEQGLVRLEFLYVEQKKWGEAWSTANRFIEFYPNEAYGWVMRANIQKLQPRAGLQQTVDYFSAHFDTPQNHLRLLELRAELALQPPAFR